MKKVLLLRGTILSALLITVDNVLALGCLSRVVAIIRAISMFHFCGHNCCCCSFCNEQHCLSHGATKPTLLPAMLTQKSLTDAFVAMVGAGRQASSHALWCFCNDEGLQLVKSILLWVLWRLCNHQRSWPSLFLLRGAHHSLAQHTRPIALFGKGLIVALFDKCSLLGILAILPLGNVHTILDVLACHLQCTCCTWLQHICAAVCRVVRYDCRCFLQSTTWKFDCCMGIVWFIPCNCLLLSSLLRIWQ